MFIFIYLDICSCMSIFMYIAISFPRFFAESIRISPSPHLCPKQSSITSLQFFLWFPDHKHPAGSQWNKAPLFLKQHPPVRLPQKAYEQFSGFLSKAVIASQRAVYESHQGPTFRKKKSSHQNPAIKWQTRSKVWTGKNMVFVAFLR